MSSMNQDVNPLEESRDFVWEAFVGLIQYDNDDWEDLWGMPVEETDISMRAARAMKHATGHESVGLFKLGYMLYIVRTYTTYTLHDLEYVMSHDWDFPAEDPDLPNHVRDMMFFPCHLVEKTSNEELDEFLRNVCNPRQMPAEVQMFLQGYGPDGTWSTPRKTILPIEVIEAVMCAEIWCAWASRKQSPLPSCQAFIALFQPTTATHVKGLANRLQKLSTKQELWGHFLLFYSGDVEFLANLDILMELAGAIFD